MFLVELLGLVDEIRGLVCGGWIKIVNFLVTVCVNGLLLDTSKNIGFLISLILSNRHNCSVWAGNDGDIFLELFRFPATLGVIYISKCGN